MGMLPPDPLHARLPRRPSLQAWQAAGSSIDWCRDLGVDGRSMRFARDIRKQLEGIIGPDGSGFDGGSGRQRAERQRDSEGREAGGSGEAARGDEQPAAEGRQRDGDRDRDGGRRDGDRRDGDRERNGKRERERERRPDSRGGKRPRHSSGGSFCDAATVGSLRMALTIGVLRLGQAAWTARMSNSSCWAQGGGTVHSRCGRAALQSGGFRCCEVPAPAPPPVARLCQPAGAAHAHAQRLPHAGGVVHPGTGGLGMR